MSDTTRKIGSFRIRVFHKSSETPLNTFEGTGDEWRLHPIMTVRHMEDRFTIRVEDAWADLLKNGEDRVIKDIQGLCTIEKFGGTIQLKGLFRVIIDASPY